MARWPAYGQMHKKEYLVLSNMGSVTWGACNPPLTEAFQMNTS